MDAASIAILLLFALTLCSGSVLTDHQGSSKLTAGDNDASKSDSLKQQPDYDELEEINDSAAEPVDSEISEPENEASTSDLSQSEHEKPKEINEELQSNISDIDFEDNSIDSNNIYEVPQDIYDTYSNDTDLEFYNSISDDLMFIPIKGGSEQSTNRFNLIFPGTLWCGPGNIAGGSETALGVFAAADSCCRTHDHCPDYIVSQTSKHNLTNNGPTIKLLCGCDTAFYKCLRSVNSIVSNKLGIIFFNIVGNDCFKEDYPIVGCKSYSFTRTRCTEYVLDKTKPKKFQWFNNPLY